jgi:glycosidase
MKKVSLPVPAMEFHVSRGARDRYGFDEAWFSLTGNVVLADFAATRRLAHRMNQVRGAALHPERAVHAAPLHVMGLIDEILHYVVGLYRQQRNPEAMARALEWLDRRVGRSRVDAALARFTEEFPPLAVYRGEFGVGAYLAGRTAGVPHREVVIEELLLLWLANVNPAFAPFRELFDDGLLADTGYAELIQAIGEFFSSQPRFGPDEQYLVDMLRSPAVASPESLSGQLEYIRERWGYLLGDFLKRILVSLDVIREEERARFLRFAAWSDVQHAPVTDFRGLESEDERFSEDRDWMPHVVMLAKSVTVWLDQLSRRYSRGISRLDQIPDEELDRLARWGITALWLIGLWERSTASQRIKQLCGNPDAGSSAYSLLDYRIADALGGEPACDNLRDRAARRRIRLATDMVPNHMGIDSRWVIEHPDWFLSLDHSPYPSYTFGGPDLSHDPRVGLFLEDHYYNRSDAAVVFRRVDRGSGATRHIYHGNDGTLTPWNDTAQLDYLKPEVRRGVIETILHVARQFPIIRFDAAMTLAKRHYQRLWYPEPGGGGAIPSRAEHGLTRGEFDRAMPVEFWREVVDRIASEMPDTLLLAEAFWLMEGYFVRTLGMHRVYNSAFMNMLRDEENANYRSVIKNTMEFDPEILKRYVNFMNNPDERTAVDQFGKGDKYFGVCTMMATLPGLPMFGHGQIEGFSERYGMEFRRAGWDETPDRDLVERHEREIFPLLHRRRVFAEAREFLLYDFFTAEGHVNEDVFAYSNRAGEERALVLYNNRYASTAGWIRTAAARAVKTGIGDEKVLRQRDLGEGLGLTRSGEHFCVFRDHLSGLEYVRSSLELFERGLHAQLDAYRCHVFLDFREVRSTSEHPWAQLAHELGGRGVPSANEALREVELRPVVEPFRGLVNAAVFRRLIGAPSQGDAQAPLEDLERRIERLVHAVRERVGGGADETAIVREVRAKLAALTKLTCPLPAAADLSGWGALLGWLLVCPLGRARGGDAAEARAGGQGGAFSREWFRGWRWDRVLADTLRELGAGPEEADQAVAMSEALIGYGGMFRAAALEEQGGLRVLEAWLSDDLTRRILRVNEFEDTWWIGREPWVALLAGLAAAAELETAADPSLSTRAREERNGATRAFAAQMMEAAGEAGYRLDRLTEWASGQHRVR